MILIMIILSWTLNLKCVMYKCFFFLSFRCGDSIVVLNESLKHIELAAKLARVSAEHMCCVCVRGEYQACFDYVWYYNREIDKLYTVVRRIL